MAIKVVTDRKPENAEKKANKFLEGKYLINISAVSCPDFKDPSKKYIALFIAYK